MVPLDKREGVVTVREKQKAQKRVRQRRPDLQEKVKTKKPTGNEKELLSRVSYEGGPWEGIRRYLSHCITRRGYGFL